MIRGLALLFSTAALVLALYSAWQVSEMQRDMTFFKNEVRAEIVKVKIAADAGPTRGELLGAAREHSHRAEELMKHGDIEGAKRELSAGQECLERAGRPTSSLDGAGSEITRAWDSVQRRVARLWREFAEQTVKEATKNASDR